MPKIRSIIDITYDGCREDCNMTKHKKRRKSDPDDVVRVNPNNNESEPHSHRYRSKAQSDKNRFFHGVQSGNQTVNVDVKVEQPAENCLTSCFSGLAKCFGKGG